MDNIGEVYTGPWINFSKGWVLGSTLTLSGRHGGLLTSFLAAFITVVASQLWKILSFTIHQLRSSEEPVDGLHHQHQIVLRNTGSAGAAALTFVQQWLAWRGKTKRPFLRSLPWVLFATVYVLIFAVLSIFSAEVSKASGDFRLVEPGTCGYWALNSGTSLQSNLANRWKTLNDSITAANYARQCYGGSANRLECSTLQQPYLNSSAGLNATCPFESGSCIYGDTAAFTVDSGLIDSRDDLGINAPDSGRVQFRKTTTCAPLRTVGLFDVTNMTDWNSQLLTYNVGPVTGISVSNNDSWAYNTVSSFSDQAYMTNTLYAFAAGTSNAWFPIERFNRTDADVSVTFVMANSVYYDEMNDDPIYGAHTYYDTIQVGDSNVTYYQSDYFVTILGCAEQYSFCNPNTGYCMSLSGVSNILDTAISDQNTTWNAIQIGALQRISLLAPFTNVYNTIDSRGAAALKAQETLSHLEQGYLPPNQWQLEVQSWFAVGLARLQRGILEYAVGPSNVLDGSHIYSPTDTVSRLMCHSQLVRYTNGTISFSVLGVGIILVLGTVIILTSLIIERVVAFFQHRGAQKSKFKYLNWVLDEKFQLQRMMYESAAIAATQGSDDTTTDSSTGLGGKWTGTKDSVPTTTEFGIKFGGWDGIDQEHPNVVIKRTSSYSNGAGVVNGGEEDEEKGSSEPERVNLIVELEGK